MISRQRNEADCPIARRPAIGLREEGPYHGIWHPGFAPQPRPLCRTSLIGAFGRWVDHLTDFGDLARRKPADLRVFANDAFILGEIDAERLIVGDVAVD